MIAIILAGFPFQGQSTYASDAMLARAEAQVAFQRHLDRTVVDGALPCLNLDFVSVRRLCAPETGLFVMTAGDLLVAGVDLGTVSGERRFADFPLAPVAGRYQVIRTEIEDPAPLTALATSGPTQRLK